MSPWLEQKNCSLFLSSRVSICLAGKELIIDLHAAVCGATTAASFIVGKENKAAIAPCGAPVDALLSGRVFVAAYVNIEGTDGVGADVRPGRVGCLDTIRCCG